MDYIKNNSSMYIKLDNIYSIIYNNEGDDFEK